MYAGVAELADARDLKSRGNFSRTGSIPVSGTSRTFTDAEGGLGKLNIAGWSSSVARRAHNPKVKGSNPFPATNLVFIWFLGAAG